MGIDLPLMWAVIILFGVMMYVVMDGFDLGIGLLFPLFPDKEDRDVMMNTVAPVWDGNETWLVLGGAGLMAAFPLAYAVILEALTLPLVLMLVGLIFRGVAFEFRFKALDHRRHLWDKAFIVGSAIATFFQGVTLGAFLNGFRVVDGRFVGGALDWLAPFPLFVGVGLLVAYGLLGATWLVLKTDGDLERRSRRFARYLIWALVLVIVIISVWTPLAHAQIRARWLAWPRVLWFLPVPILVAASAFGLVRSLRAGRQVAPFLLTLVLVFLAYSGLGISIWPHVIPPALTIWDAAAPAQSMGFALVGALFIIPIILMYTAMSYWVFRGKVRRGEGYH
ncbi:cytochrome d ubiquinol oxidase subunit II [Pseudoxanthomonas winnipegensis]|uniref:cytochrome d ubiquinol oxidase subunit II n=1 Tax=Pseudoxanthomonas winnipegensis TaxID=2480810 RepID=UPI0030F42808